MPSQFELFVINEIMEAVESIEPAEALAAILERAKGNTNIQQYGMVRGPVDPAEARQGIFLKSFRLREFQEMLKWCGQTESAMVRHGVKGELVFTKRAFMWYVYLLQEGSVITT